MTKVEIKEGKAFNVTPDVEITKDELSAMKQDLEQQISNCESQILVNQNNLESLKTKLTECEAICTELGY